MPSPSHVATWSAVALPRIMRRSSFVMEDLGIADAARIAGIEQLRHPTAKRLHVFLPNSRVGVAMFL